MLKVEHEWTTAAGLPATVKYVSRPTTNFWRWFWEDVTGTNPYRCGYVDVPAGHPMHGRDYGDVPADVHGGLTYARANDDGTWRFGFDCSHRYDTEAVCTLEYVKGECEKLAAFLSSK